MPSPLLMLEAMSAAGVAAVLVCLLCAWPWGRHVTSLSPQAEGLPSLSPRGGGSGWGETRRQVGFVLAAAAGIFVGCWFLGIRPHWPPREDIDRLLIVLFPAVFIVEFRAAVSSRAPWLVWALRVVIAVGAARLLLHDSIYLSDLAGPGSRKWTPSESWIILGGLAVALTVEWVLMTHLIRRAPGRSVPVALAFACAGAGITVMLSGYASGGQIGLAVAAALVGATLASLVLPGAPDVESLVGIGVVGLFAQLAIGHFFGELKTGHALLLFLAPLLCWVPELSLVRRLRPTVRGVARVILTAVPVAVALFLAQKNFVTDSSRNSPGDKEPTLEDYMNYGK